MVSFSARLGSEVINLLYSESETLRFEFKVAWLYHLYLYYHKGWFHLSASFFIGFWLPRIKSEKGFLSYSRNQLVTSALRSDEIVESSHCIFYIPVSPKLKTVRKWEYSMLRAIKSLRRAPMMNVYKAFIEKGAIEIKGKTNQSFTIWCCVAFGVTFVAMEILVPRSCFKAQFSL